MARSYGIRLGKVGYVEADIEVGHVVIPSHVLSLKHQCRPLVLSPHQFIDGSIVARMNVPTSTYIEVVLGMHRKVIIIPGVNRVITIGIDWLRSGCSFSMRTKLLLGKPTKKNITQFLMHIVGLFLCLFEAHLFFRW